MQHLFEFGFAAHQHALHLFRCFEFKILAEIAIGPCDRDFLGVLWNFGFHERFVFAFTSFEAAPRND